MQRTAAILFTAACSGVSWAQPLPCEGWATIPGQTNPYHEGSAYAVTYFDFDGEGPESEQLVIAGESLDLLDTQPGTVFRWDGTRWHAVGDQFDASVYSLQAFGGELYAAGDFSTVSGQATPLLARWRDGRWQGVTAADGRTIQRRTGDLIRAMHIYAGRLVFAGRLGLTGQSAPSNIASWDGSAFGEYATGIQGYVRALTTHRGELVAGGDFTQAGGQSLNRLARWNGTAWRPVGPTAANQGANGTVRALASFEGSLYIGGDFGGVGSPYFPAPSFVALSDFGWIRSGGGVSGGNVRALLPTSDGLIVAGAFRTVGGVAHRGLVTLRNDVWSRELGDVPLPDPDLTIPPSIGAMVERNGTIAFAGEFDGAGGAGGNLVVAKTPEGWRSFAPGGLAGGVPFCMVQFRGEYYIGGSFRSAGDQILGGLAKWDGRRWVAVPGWEGASTIASLVAGDDKLWVYGQLKTPHPIDRPGAVWAAVFDGSEWRWSAPHAAPMVLRRATYWNGRLVMPGRGNSWTWDGETWADLPSTTPEWPAVVDPVTAFEGRLYSVRDGPEEATLVEFQNGSWTALPGPRPESYSDMAVHRNQLVYLGNSSDLVLWNAAEHRRYGLGYLSSFASVGETLYFVLPDTLRYPYPTYLFRLSGSGQPEGVPRFNSYGDNGRSVGEFYGNLLAAHPVDYPARQDTDLNVVFISGPPAVIGQPITPPTCPHTQLRLDLVVLGSGNTYQWRRNGVPIDGATESVYADVFPGDSGTGDYDCVVSNACGQTISASVRYAPCFADHDCSGFIDFFDYAEFTSDFEAGSPRADVDRNGFVDYADYDAFVTSFEMGC